VAFSAGGFTSEVCGMVGFFDGMAEQMVNFVYPMWSQVVDNDEFDKMVEASPTASRKASAN
jgi:hypothetical protein